MKNIIEAYADYVAAIDEYGRFSLKEDLSVRSFGVTSLLFDDGDTQLMIDAMVTRPGLGKSFLGKVDSDRERVGRYIQECDMQRLKAIFASHSHYDHVLDLPEFAGKTGALVYGTASTLNVARGSSVPEEQLVEFKANETYQVGRFRVRVLPSLHSKPAFYNNDLGKEITKPVTLPASTKKFSEGGSYDFLITHGDFRILVRPSCNYIPDSLKNIRCEVLFLGTAKLCKEKLQKKERFYRETVGMVKPKIVIPIHWDNFLLPMEKSDFAFPKLLEDTDAGYRFLIPKCKQDGVDFTILPSCKY